MYRVSQCIFFFKEIFNTLDLAWNADLLYSFGFFLLKRIVISPIIQKTLALPANCMDHTSLSTQITVLKFFYHGKEDYFELFSDAQTRLESVYMIIFEDLFLHYKIWTSDLVYLKKGQELFSNETFCKGFNFKSVNSIYVKNNKISGDEIFSSYISSYIVDDSFWDFKIDPKFKTLEIIDERHYRGCHDGYYTKILSETATCKCKCEFVVSKSMMDTNTYNLYLKDRWCEFMVRGGVFKKQFNLGEHFPKIETVVSKYSCRL